jgi:RNA polymerase sigma-70 factor (ECF subfamily)
MAAVLDDDATLARRVMRGVDPDAEAELSRRFAPRIRLYGIRHLRAEDAAADLVQEVLVIVLTALRQGRVEDASIVDRFVLGTCRNVVSGWRRGARRREHVASQLEVVVPADLPVPPARVDTLRLMRCMERLEARARSVLVLTYFEERSADEIGGSLGLSPGNVRVIRHRALHQVKDCIEGGAA